MFEPTEFSQTPETHAGMPVSDLPAEPAGLQEPEPFEDPNYGSDLAGEGEELSDDEPVDAPLRSPESYEQWELDDLYRRGELRDRALVDRRERLIEAEQDRIFREEGDRQQFLAHEAEEAGHLEEARLIRDSALAANSGRLEPGPNAELVEEANRRALADYDAQAKAINTALMDRTIRDALVEAVGDSGELRRAIEPLDTTGLLMELYSAAFRTGQSVNSATGPDSREFARLLADERKQAVDGFKAANAPPDNPDTFGTKGRTGKALTLAQIDAMPMSEWLSLGDHESRTKMLEDAHVRAARGGGRG